MFKSGNFSTRIAGLRNKSSIIELIMTGILFTCAIFGIFMIILIIYFIFQEAAPALEGTSIEELLFEERWLPSGTPPGYGAKPLIIATFLVMIGAMVVAVPLSIGTAIFIAEVAPPKLRETVKPAVEVLASIPSVVYGFFGLVVMSNWLRVTFDQPSGQSWLGGSIILGIMAIPTITSVAEDVISSVPREFKDGSLALGTTRWQTISGVTLPSASSGITAAIILGMSRAIGETMAVLMVTGNAPLIPDPLTNVFSPVRTLTATIGIEAGEAPLGSTHYHTLFFLALILLVITLIMNTAAMIIIMKLRQAYSTKPRKKKESSRPWVSTTKRYTSMTLNVLGLIFLLWLAVELFGLMTIAFVITLIVSFIIIKHQIPPKIMQKLVFTLVTICATIVLLILSIILYDLFSRGLPAISWTFLTDRPRKLGKEGGIFPAIVGTIYLVTGAIIIALPIGVGAAIYLTEYIKEGRMKDIINSGLDLLNSTPSIVFGLFGLAFLVLYLDLGISMIAGQITLAIMVIPTIVRTSQEALKSVPQSVREGSLALGASKWQTTYKVVLPAALPGILTGTILSIGRAAGETAPIMFTAVVFRQRFLPTSVFSPVMALPYHLFLMATTVPGAENSQYGTAVVLLILVLLTQLSAILIRNHYRKKLKW